MIVKTCSGRPAGGRRGAAALELATVLPMLVMLVFGAVEVGRVADVRQILGNAAREGGRQASTGQISDADVAAVVSGYLRNAGLTAGNVAVTIKNLSNTGVGSQDAAQLDQFQVTVTIPYSDVRLASTSLLMSPSASIVAKAYWYSMKDKPYAAPPEPPIE